MGSEKAPIRDDDVKATSKRSLTRIFRSADWEDLILMFLGTLGAIGDGCSTNILLLFVSHVMNNLGQGTVHGAKLQPNFMQEIEKSCLYFIYVGLAALVVAFTEGYCWSRTSERQVLRLRYKYLESILRQEVGFFEAQEASTPEIINSISKDTSVIQEVLSEKMQNACLLFSALVDTAYAKRNIHLTALWMGIFRYVPLFIMHSSVFISGLAFSAYFSWRLSLVAFPLLLFLVIPGLTYGKYLLHISHKSYNQYAKANAIVEQALSSIKTIYAFTAENRIVEKFAIILDRTVKLGIKQGIAKGLAVGSTGLSFAIWAFLAWYGGTLVIHHGETGGRIYAAGVSFVLGGLSLGMALPELKHFIEASIAAARILERIERVPLINECDLKGMVLNKTHGDIEFEGIWFAYPSRPESIVLQEFSLKIPAGKTVALVGSSGSGKSTAIALLQRFYDANSGVVRIDGIDIKKLQLKWLRRKMGLVSQDHSLFGMSIMENILLGKSDATMDEVVAAAMTANAHNFISQLPEGYETKVGEKGSLISGGQKQRISIARAIIRNPTILLLDEATSALDSESEKLVQNALDQASMGRTTLVVAHKLSTIKNADYIAVVDGGKIIEIGSHRDLNNKKDGLYARLVKLQRQFSLDDREIVAESHLSSSITQNSVIKQSTNRNSPSPFILSIHDATVNSPGSCPPPSFTRLLSLNSPEWRQAILGSMSAVVFGSLQPIYALSIGGMIAAFFIPDRDEMMAIIRKYALIFCSLSIVSIIVNLLQHYNFAYMGELLTKRIRLKMLTKILTFEAAWFDDRKNSSAALCNRLNKEASLVKTIVADRVSLLVQSISGVIISMTMGLIVAWKLALVMIAIQPFTVFCYYGKKIVLSSVSLEFVKAQNISTQIAKEAVCNHRIVTSFGCIQTILHQFEEAQKEPRKTARKKAWVAGAALGCSPCLCFLGWALDFWYGGKLATNGEASAADVFKTFFILVSTGKVIADACSMTSDLAKGATAVASVFEILDRKSLIPMSQQQVGRHQGKLCKIKGKLQMINVDFAYPTRTQCLVLRDLSLEIQPGSSIGLVGGSGCGKSTIIGLIQRFYDVNRGVVKIDGVDVRELDLCWYRGFMALVGQEPVMFSGSIRDNILFGKPEASEDEVVEAARAANAHEFISSLKNGYDTNCGERGVQLSGGQKQRIAIARAIIRNPRILLLDEATSALDIHSEQVVQEALDRTMTGRTTIVVAHRLNTIKNLHSIAYLSEGKVTERGSYTELMNKKHDFYRLANLQR